MKQRQIAKAAFTPAQHVARNMLLEATCCAQQATLLSTNCCRSLIYRQHVVGNKLFVAGNKLLVAHNMLVVRATCSRATCCAGVNVA